MNQTSPPCIQLSNQTLGHFQPYNHTAVKGNVTVLQGLTPIKPPNATGPYQPVTLPRCKQTRSWPPEWSGCQNTLQLVFLTETHEYTFTPKFPTIKNETFHRYNYTYQNPKLSNLSSPFEAWLLCNTLGACSDISPMSMLKGGVLLSKYNSTIRNDSAREQMQSKYDLPPNTCLHSPSSFPPL